IFTNLLFLADINASGVVGGRFAKPHSRPYMASLQYEGHHSCGGILFQKDFVLTATHCKQYSAAVQVSRCPLGHVRSGPRFSIFT
uniref:Peptidase S1 domain-containing protein n=1 Tax=Nothobranchius furzeri TaxID=105023 RepID=A0A8C6PXR8_NOTFU